MATQTDLSWAEVGRRVREARMVAGLSQAELGGAIGLDRTMVAKIEAGSRRIDALELIRLTSTLEIPLDQLLNRQPDVVSRRGRLVDDDGVTETARESYRLEVALLSWLREVRQLVDVGVLGTQELATYPRAVESEIDGRRAAQWLRDELRAGQDPLPTLMEICQRAGQFVLLTDLPGDGASLVDGEIAAAVVSRRGDPGRRRATAAHELGHLVLGDEYSSDLGVHASRHEREVVVDAFAAELLLPMQAIAGAARALDRPGLVRLAAHYRTSWSLAVRQAVRAEAIEDGEAERWRQATPTRAELMEAVGWAPQPDLDAVRVPPGYADAVMEARRRGLITTARAVELMHGQLDEPDFPSIEDDDLAP